MRTLLFILLSGSFSVSAQSPIVTGRLPQRNATAVPRDTSVSISFSTNMHNSTCDSSAIAISGCYRGMVTKAGRGSYSGAGTSNISFSPSARFIANEKIHITISRKAKNTSGDTMTAPHVYTFTTATKGIDSMLLYTNDLPFHSVNPVAATLIDIDLDGDLDGVQSTNFNGLIVNRNIGNGNFRNPETCQSNIQIYGPSEISTADVNRDGYPDMIVAGRFGTAGVFINNAGTFCFTSASYATGAATQSIQHVASGDFNGDGSIDFAISRNATNQIFVFFNTGSGAFTLDSTYAAGVTDPTQIQAGDVDQDGDMDLAYSGSGGNGYGARFMLNNGSGRFNVVQQNAFTSTLQSFNLVDVDRDSDLDVIAGNYAGFRVFKNNGSGTFTTYQTFNNSGIAETQTADMNGDGNMDLVIKRAGNNVFDIFYNNGSGTMTLNKSFAAGSFIMAFNIGDIDNDGDMDFVLPDINMNRTYVIRTTLNKVHISGLGTYQSPSTTPNTTNNPFGRFMLSSQFDFNILDTLELKLTGVRAGAGNFKLWKSADSIFNNGNDMQIGSTVVSDPGNNKFIYFRNLHDTISTSGKWYFVTTDVSPGGSGQIRGQLADNGSFHFRNAGISTILSNVWLSNANTMLPVTLLNFDAERDGKDVMLKWRTASEINNDHFKVLKSFDNHDFAEIGEVASGTPFTLNTYLFTDIDGCEEQVAAIYYKLWQTDIDGTSSELGTAVVMPGTVRQNAISLFPNPSFGRFVIEGTSSREVILQVFDMSGRNVHSAKQAVSTQVDLTFLPKGIYMVRCTSEDLLSSHKIVLH